MYLSVVGVGPLSEERPWWGGVLLPRATQSRPTALHTGTQYRQPQSGGALLCCAVLLCCCTSREHLESCLQEPHALLNNLHHWYMYINMTALLGEGMTKLDQSPPFFIASVFTALQTVNQHTNVSQSSFSDSHRC